MSGTVGIPFFGTKNMTKMTVKDMMLMHAEQVIKSAWSCLSCRLGRERSCQNTD